MYQFVRAKKLKELLYSFSNEPWREKGSELGLLSPSKTHKIDEIESHLWIKIFSSKKVNLDTLFNWLNVQTEIYFLRTFEALYVISSQQIREGKCCVLLSISRTKQNTTVRPMLRVKEKTTVSVKKLGWEWRSGWGWEILSGLES